VSEQQLRALLALLSPLVTQFGAELLAELAKAQMVQDGYEITGESVTPEGVRVVAWEKQVTA
jgi:hypothetical protein